jgi:hypothetical protein
MTKKETDYKPEINASLKAIAMQTTVIVNDFWIDSLMEMKGLPITKELVEGLAKLSKGQLLKEIEKVL